MDEQQHPILHNSSVMAEHFDPGISVSPTRQVGEQLERLRKSKKWSIEDVSARLKIAPYKLRELELGDYSHLPDTMFAIGVVRSYAKMIGIDPIPLTDMLRDSSTPISSNISLPTNNSVWFPRQRIIMNFRGTPKPRLWLWAISLVGVLAAIIAVWCFTETGEGWLVRLKIDNTHTIKQNVSSIPLDVRSVLETSILTNLPKFRTVNKLDQESTEIAVGGFAQKTC
ncbi:helix-turn-helix domain-containing protein [Candidatus Vallotia tarda]|uniref:helix-turn-helix domain-containing protein n=1 Tax=Candidatus Vallotiella hemipterorum TaxID=1177213 RepID=UPI001FE70ABD|nr:helix-turn-helix domain-containing protein [Candidatus Vallotia tarda]